VSAQTAPQVLAAPKPSRAGLAMAVGFVVIALAGGGIWYVVSTFRDIAADGGGPASVASSPAEAYDAFANATSMVTDAIAQNGGHAMIWAMTFHANGTAEIDLQDADDRTVIKRFAYRSGTLESTKPLELDDADQARVKKATFRKSAARLDMLPQLLPRASAKAGDGATVKRVTIHRTADQSVAKPIQAVVLETSSGDVTHEYWARGSFRCERTDGTTCPGKP
jgi:hypothetical protein